MTLLSFFSLIIRQSQPSTVEPQRNPRLVSVFWKCDTSTPSSRAFLCGEFSILYKKCVVDRLRFVFCFACSFTRFLFATGVRIAVVVALCLARAPKKCASTFLNFSYTARDRVLFSTSLFLSGQVHSKTIVFRFLRILIQYYFENGGGLGIHR